MASVIQFRLDDPDEDDPDEADVEQCPHGVSFSEPCEDCGDIDPEAL